MSIRVWPVVLAMGGWAVGCEAPPAPQDGSYQLQAGGTFSVISYADAAPVTSPASIDTPLVLYVDVGALNTPIEQIFFDQGVSSPPRHTRGAEMRLFPGVTEEESDMITLATYFDGIDVAGLGQILYTSYSSMVLPGKTEPTPCYPFQRYRIIGLDGNWADDQWDVAVEIVYLDFCFDAAGNLLTDGYPERRYELTGTVTPVYLTSPPEGEEGEEAL